MMPREQIIERAAEPVETHRAVLRFRTPTIGELTGIEFRPVTVRKGVWYNDGFRAPDIRLANMYSRKALGALIDRSIWRTESVTRWIAPETFYDQLIEQMRDRITWNCEWGYNKDYSLPVISTAPLPLVAEQVGVTHEMDFRYAPITVVRFRVPHADVYQTVYYPTPDHALYRASITGSLLICEFAGNSAGDTRWVGDVSRSFALNDVDFISTEKGAHHQSYGKIAPVPEELRRELLHRLTAHYGIFSVGRFATWRNILLDDVVHDIAVVRRLIKSTPYERQLVAVGRGQK